MDGQNQDLLIVVLTGLQADVKEMRSEFRREIDELKAFKWKVIGMGTVVSAIVSAAVPLTLKFVFNV